MTKKQAILAWLRWGRPISKRFALDQFKCRRLPSVVFDLREEGWVISTTMVAPDEGRPFAVYRLHHSQWNEDAQARKDGARAA